MELPRVNSVMLKLAKQNVARALSKREAAELKKEGFVPMGPQGATAPPPMDPMAAGAPPPAAGGMPMDPAMGGAPPPMDPAMGGAPPPMDPAAGGAPPMDPAAGGAPPPGQPVMVSLDDLMQLFAMIQEGGAPGGEEPPVEEAPAPNEEKAPEGGRNTADAIDELSGKLDQLIELLGGAVAGAEVPPGAGGAMPPEAMPMGGPAGIPAGEPLPPPEVPGGVIPEGAPPGPVAPMSGMVAQASVESRVKETLKDATPEPEPTPAPQPKQAAAPQPKPEPVPKSEPKKAADKQHALRIHRMIQNLNRGK